MANVLETWEHNWVTQAAHNSPQVPAQIYLGSMIRNNIFYMAYLQFHKVKRANMSSWLTDQK